MHTYLSFGYEKVSCWRERAVANEKRNLAVRTVRVRRLDQNAFAGFLVDRFGVALPVFVGVVRLVEDFVGGKGNFRATDRLLELIGRDADERRFAQEKTVAIVANQRQAGLIGKEHVR